MKKAAFLALVLLATHMVEAGTKQRTVPIEGRWVVVGPAANARPAVEIRKLTFYPALIEETRQPCTVAVGYIVSHLPHSNFVVTLEFEMLNYKPGHRYTHSQGTFTVKVVQPAPGVPRKFIALGPSWFGLAADGSPAPGARHHGWYLTKITHRHFDPKVDGFNPNKPKP